MALSGLFFVLFLLVHIVGNFMLYIGADAFNNYTSTMAANPLIKGMEIVMIILFLVHILTSALLTLENRAARPEKYAMDVSAGQRTFMSSNMFVTGSLVLLFVIIHLINFKFGDWSNAPGSTATMYDLVAVTYTSVFWTVFYVVAVIILGFHLNHAFQSAFQTLGLNHQKYTPFIKKLGTLYSIFVALVFASFPVYFYFSQLSAGS